MRCARRPYRTFRLSTSLSRATRTSAWYGVGAPKGTPCAVIDKTHKEIGAGLVDPKMKARFADLRSATMPMTPAELGKLIADETGEVGQGDPHGQPKPA